jgi:hypothetical protein
MSLTTQVMFEDKVANGPVLTDMSEIIVYLRSTYNDTKADDAPNTTLNDAEIRAVYEAIGDDESMILDQMATGKVPEAKAAAIAPKISAATKESIAKELAMRSDNDAQISEHLTRIPEAKRFLAFSARTIMLDLVRLYTGDEMRKWPVIGAVSHEEGKKDRPTGHPNPDGYLRPTRRRGSSGTAMAYWSDYFSENLKAIRDLREQLKAVKDSKTIGEIAKAQAENRLGKAIEAMKAKVRAGIELFQQLDRAAGYKAVKVEWEQTRVPLLDEDGNEQTDPKNPKRILTRLVEAEVEDPIVIRDSEPGVTDFRTFTIIQFCSLDFEKATANGGTLESLLDTVKRVKKDAEGFDIEDMEDLRMAFNTLASFLLTKENKIAVLRELVTENEDTDEMLTAMADVYYAIKPVVETNTPRINAARDKQDAILNPVKKDGTTG